MQVEVGLHTSCEYFSKPYSGIGEARLSLEALLGRLELELGLPEAESRTVDRLLAYRECLDETRTKDSFFSTSFEKDSFGVTRVLLDWRDRWYEGGWTGEFADLGASNEHRRLAQMQGVEQLAKHRVPLGRGQRLQRLLLELEKGLATQIESLVLLDKYRYFPHCWQSVFEHIGYQESENIRFQPRAANGTDLHAVQTHVCDILNRSSEPNRVMIELSGDDSILSVHSSSRDVTARLVSELLQDDVVREKSLVVAENVGIILDNAFERSGLPRCGFEYRSRFRAVDQVIRLALALLWDPIRPSLLLQFLIHPVGPLDARTRGFLADAVSAEPGIGGPEWERAVENLKGLMKDREQDETLAERSIAELDTALDYWFHSRRFPPEDGAAMEVVMERVNRCGDWLRRNAHMETQSDTDDQLDGDSSEGESTDEKRAMYGRAYVQYRLVSDGLAKMHERGKTRIPKQELDRLLDEFLQPSPDPLAHPEARHVNGATHAGAVVDPFDTVIWWDMRATSRREATPWTVEEQAVLNANNVHVESNELRLERQTEWSLRPLVNCRERILMVSHPANSQFIPHSLQTLLKSRFVGTPELSVEPSFDSSSRISLERLGVAAEPQSAKPLIEPRPYWKLPNAHIAMRDKESYSSLESLFNTPHGYVIDYVAKLRKYLTGDLIDEQALRGTLAHLLLKEFFDSDTDWQSVTDQDMADFVSERLPALIDTVGAYFHEPGRKSSQISLHYQISRALIRLVHHLRSSEVAIHKISSEYETAQAYSFGGVMLEGVIDLLLETSMGELVIDVKWGGESFRANQLAENRYLQLATYAYMRKKALDQSTWPWIAFFIIESGQIVAPDASVFPNARVVEGEEDEGIEELWNRMNETYKWRRKQLESGNLEINIEANTEFIDERPDDVLDPLEPSKFESHGSLIGWRG